MKTLPAVDRLIGEPVELLAKSEKGDGRSFTMVAYTGAAVSRCYGSLVIDIDGMALPRQKMPILEDHSDRCGYSTSIEKTGGQVVIKGRLLANDEGDGIAKDCADGFPFQASVGVQFARLEEIMDGDEKTVNGRLVKGPAYVATKSTLLEASFVALGADSNTSAAAFAPDDTATINVITKEPLMSDLETLKANAARVDSISKALVARPDLALAAISDGSSLEVAMQRLVAEQSKEIAELKAKLDASEKKGGAFLGIPHSGPARDALNRPAATPDAPAAKEDFSNLAPVERARKEFAVAPSIRAEFKGQDGEKQYAAYLAAEADGRVAILEPLHGQYGTAR